MKTNKSSILTTPWRIAATCLIAFAAAVPCTRAADGNPPDRLTYQGYLVDAAGTALGQAAPKNYDVIFRVYNHETASGAAYRLWTEMQTVTVDKGYFSVVLGEGGAYGTESHPAISTLFTNQVDASDRFIEMTVRGIGAGGTDSSILPRLRLMSSPYAQLAKLAVNAKYLVNAAGGQIVNVSGTNVGINNPSPTSSLDVKGTLTASALTVSGGVTMNGAVSATSVTATTVTGTAVNGTTITASSAFVGPGTIPVGGIIMWSGSTPPTGWALCNGQSANGVQTPDLRGRFILSSGSGSGLTARSLWQTGGEENHTLSIPELPSHEHSVDPPNTTTTSDSHAHKYNDPRVGSFQGVSHDSNGTTVEYPSDWGSWTSSESHDHRVNIAAFNSAGAGSGWAHNTMPPFYVLAFIMRVQ